MFSEIFRVRQRFSEIFRDFILSEKRKRRVHRGKIFESSAPGGRGQGCPPSSLTRQRRFYLRSRPLGVSHITEKVPYGRVLPSSAPCDILHYQEKYRLASKILARHFRTGRNFFLMAALNFCARQRVG